MSSEGRVDSGAWTGQAITRAIAISLIGIFLLQAMGAVVKHLAVTYPAPELSALRNAIGIVPSVLVLVGTRGWRTLRRDLVIPQWRLALWRGVLVAIAQVSFYLSLAHLAFATASTLIFAKPLIVTVLTATLLRELVGLWKWAAVAAGFIGIVLVARPEGDAFSLYALLPVIAALAYALSFVSVRLIKTPVPSATLNVYAQLGALIGAIVFMFGTGEYVGINSLEDWFWIGAMGVMGGAGVLCVIIAYRLTSPSNLAPFDYFGIPFAIGLGWFFFDEAPFDQLFPGVLFIVCGGLMIVWQERRAKRSDEK